MTSRFSLPKTPQRETPSRCDATGWGLLVTLPKLDVLQTNRE